MFSLIFYASWDENHTLARDKVVSARTRVRNHTSQLFVVVENDTVCTR